MTQQPNPDSPAWEWRELHPLTRIVVATYSDDCIGEQYGQLPFEEYRRTMGEAFPRRNSYNVTPERFNLLVARGAVIDWLREVPAGRLSDMAKQLGSLAAGVGGAVELAEDVRYELQIGGRVHRRDRRSPLEASLRVLSNIASQARWNRRR